MKNGFYDMLRKKLDTTIAGEKNRSLRDLMQCIDADILEMEFLTPDVISEFGYKLVDFLQDEVVLVRMELNPTFGVHCSEREREIREKQFKEISSIWKQTMESVVSLQKTFSMSDEELSKKLKEQLKSDAIESMLIKQENE